MELLRQELSKDEFDPKLEKLRIDLLERTKERLNKQARINPDDPAIFTILADINFHQGKLEEASANISKALENKSGPVANYVFAKILFRKGNLTQAFDQMGTVLESMPDSPVVFEDFQFLYSCKSYGVATARKICRNTNFLKRSTPVAGAAEIPEAPESPFENDPTIVTAPTQTQNTNQPQPIESAQINDGNDDDSPLPDETEQNNLPDDPGTEISELPDTQLPEPVDGTEIERPLPVGVATETEVENPAEDPEKEKIKKAEYWLNQAAKQIENRRYDDADNNWKKAVELYPGLPGKDEIRSQLDTKFDLFKRYKKAKELFEAEKYDQAIPTLEEAYKEEPIRFKEAAFLIGKSYLLRPEPDYDNALKYLAIVLEDKDTDPLFRRDIEWTKLEILYGTRRYEDADSIFQNFMKNEESFTRNQVNFNQLRYGLWYEINKTWVNIGFGIFALMFLTVFLLRLMPALTFSLSDPVASAKKAFEKARFDRAISLAEKALTKKQPVQIERELLEILTKAHFELKNFVRCQENARIILEKFPGNTTAWGYLAKASMASHDTSNEAITMYEAIYTENPHKTEYLPVLAKHYAETKNKTVEAMGVLFTYYQNGSKEPPVIIALAEGYVQNRSMGKEVITVLEDALKIKDKIEFRELLARNFAKAGQYADAARECIKVLNENINNMGIHVVYTSSMKKLKMVNEAIAQYEDFMRHYPGNPQLMEIIAGLKKDATGFSSETEESILSDIPDELPMPDLPEPGSYDNDGLDIDSFVEPPPKGFEDDNGQNIPLPDFLKNDEYAFNYEQPTPAPDVPLPASAINLPTLNPFDDAETIFDDFVGDLPEELGGNKTEDLSIGNFATQNMVTEDDLLTEIPPIAPPTAQNPVNGADRVTAPSQLSAAREKAAKKKWDEVIGLLSPEFASERNKDTGLLLADAWLQKGKAGMAMEIIETLDFDPEIMGENIKDVLYRTGVALETEKKYTEALKIYDMICNVDINYKDAFDRSDKIYTRQKS